MIPSNLTANFQQRSKMIKFLNTDKKINGIKKIFLPKIKIGEVKESLQDYDVPRFPRLLRRVSSIFYSSNKSASFCQKVSGSSSASAAVASNSSFSIGSV